MLESQSWLICTAAHNDGAALPARVLTRMQREVIRLVSLGCSVAQAALILHISARTAENHKNRAMDRLGIHKAALLTRFAIESGIAPVGDVLTEGERHILPGAVGSDMPHHRDCDAGANSNCATG